jgi:hypothetical protein
LGFDRARSGARNGISSLHRSLGNHPPNGAFAFGAGLVNWKGFQTFSGFAKRNGFNEERSVLVFQMDQGLGDPNV